MADEHSDDLDLVRRRYIAAEGRLRELSVAVEGLVASSEQLETARGSLDEASKKITELAKMHHALVEQTQRVVETVSALDPASLHEIIEELQSVVSAAADAAEDRNAKLLARVKQLGRRSNTVFMLAIIGLIAGVIAAAGVSWIILQPLIGS